MPPKNSNKMQFIIFQKQINPNAAIQKRPAAANVRVNQKQPNLNRRGGRDAQFGRLYGDATNPVGQIK